MNVLIGLTLALALPQATPVTPASETASGFLYKELALGGVTYAYCVYVPPHHPAGEALPLILFLHGSGERGDDGFHQTEFGLPAAIRRCGVRPRALIVMPQCRAGQTWSDDMARMALRCVEQTAREYKVDPERLYLTGLSLGGAGTWLIGAALADRFAALVPVCGFGGTEDAEKLARVPIWAFHGARDEAVPVAQSRDMVAAIRRVGGQVKYTEYPDLGHSCWDAAYTDPELYRWLFQQRRAAKPDAREQESPPGEPRP
jgi:predicted peptidase